MPDFRTEIDIDVDEFWDECSKFEKKELIDLLVDEGLVRRVANIDVNGKHHGPNLMEIEWNTMIDKLSLLRQRLSIEEEETIKALVSKYI